MFHLDDKSESHGDSKQCHAGLRLLFSWEHHDPCFLAFMSLKSIDEDGFWFGILDRCGRRGARRPLLARCLLRTGYPRQPRANQGSDGTLEETSPIGINCRLLRLVDHHVLHGFVRSVASGNSDSPASVASVSVTAIHLCVLD